MFEHLNTDKWISSKLDSLFYVILSAVSEEILSEMAPTDSKKKKSFISLDFASLQDLLVMF